MRPCATQVLAAINISLPSRPRSLHSRKSPARRRRHAGAAVTVECQQQEPAPDDEAASPSNRLAAIIKRKQRQVAAQLEELGIDALEERLQSATQTPVAQPYRLTHLVARSVQAGQPPLVLELSRHGAVDSPEALAQLAVQYVAAGADALAVRTDDEDTPQGVADLFAVCRAVQVPVLRRDWMLHPLQVSETKEAGAAGLLGTLASVSGRGAPIMSSFAASLGLDCPVEIVNMAELEAMAGAGCAFFGLNLSVGLSVSIPGFGSDVARGLLGELPFGAISLVGARSVEEARQARLAGADAIFVKWELLQAHTEGGGPLRALVEELQYATSGDD